jgi:hypothetical protein
MDSRHSGRDEVANPKMRGRNDREQAVARRIHFAQFPNLDKFA